MMSSTRKTRNYKEKSSMLAFGHFALPLAAVVALGLLFIGIKLFFLSPADRGGIEVTPDTPPVVTTPDTGSSAEDPALSQTGEDGVDDATAPDDISVVETPGTSDNLTLAGPIASPGSNNNAASNSSHSSGASSNTPSRGGVGNASAGRRPSGNAPYALTSRYGVQIGAFLHIDGAEKVVEEVTKEGYQAASSTVATSGKTYHRVRVAAGDTKEQAEKVAAELEKKGYPILIVINQ